jgi:hypothetical protein
MARCVNSAQSHGLVVLLCLLSASMLSVRAHAQQDVRSFVTWEGIQPIWNSAVSYGKSVGNSYLQASNRGMTKSDTIDKIIDSLCLRNAAAGAGTGFIGLIGAPARMGASLYIQAGS